MIGLAVSVVVIMLHIFLKGVIPCSNQQLKLVEHIWTNILILMNKSLRIYTNSYPRRWRLTSSIQIKTKFTDKKVRSVNHSKTFVIKFWYRVYQKSIRKVTYFGRLNRFFVFYYDEDGSPVHFKLKQNSPRKKFGLSTIVKLLW
jgi:hypothetical protein